MEDFDQPAPPRLLDLHETSVDDPAPQLIQEDEAEVTYKIVDESSIRGKTKLFDSLGYSYTIKRRTSQSTTWRCSIQTKSVNCPATIREVGQSFLAGPRQHIHQPNPGSSVAASITAICKSTAKDQPFTSVAEIATNLIKKYVPTTAPCPALPTIQWIAANANYHRAKNRP